MNPLPIILLAMAIVVSIYLMWRWVGTWKDIETTVKFIRFVDTTHQDLLIGDKLKKTEREFLFGILSACISVPVMIGGEPLWIKLCGYVLCPFIVIGMGCSYRFTKRLRTFCSDRQIVTTEKLVETIRDAQ